MKKTLCSLLFLAAVMASAQSQKADITTDKQLLEYQFLKDGGFYVQFGKITAMMEGPRLNKTMFVYSAAVEKETERDLSDIKLKAEGLLSPDGKLTGFRNQAFTAFADEKLYYIAGKEYKIVKEEENKGPLKDIIRVINTNQYQVYFGKPKKRKDKSAVEGEEFTDLFFSRRDIKTLALKQFPVQFPAESFPGGKMFYQYQDHTNDKAYFLLNKLTDNKENRCVLVSYDYEGKLVDNIPFTLKLDNGNDFMFFNGSQDNIVEVIKGGMERQEWTEGAAISTKIAADGFYAYGRFGLRDGKKSKIEGFFVYKYDFSGKLAWKLEKALRNTDKKRSSDNSMVLGSFDLALIDNHKLALSCREENSDNYVFYQLDSRNGNIIAEKNTAVFYQNDFEWSRKMAFAGLQNAVAVAGNKKTAKNQLDVPTIYAMLYSDEAARYINSKTDSKFETRLCEKGIYVIEENHAENVFRLLKFDWKE